MCLKLHFKITFSTYVHTYMYSSMQHNSIIYNKTRLEYIA